jgi:hypothetical protein
MTAATTLAAAALIGLLTTSAVMVGTTLGLYGDLSKKMLARMLAFAADVLISSLGLELAFDGARELHARGFATEFAWAFISGGLRLERSSTTLRRVSSIDMAELYVRRQGFANM